MSYAPPGLRAGLMATVAAMGAAGLLLLRTRGQGGASPRAMA